MIFPNSNILSEQGRNHLKLFILTIVSLAFPFGAALAVSAQVPAENSLNSIKFYYPVDGSVKIEVVSDRPLGNYQIKTIGNKTVIQIKGAGSKLHPLYLVRNSFDVKVSTEVKKIDGEAETELTIFSLPGTVVLPARESDKTFFIVASSAASKPGVVQSNKTKDPSLENFKLASYSVPKEKGENPKGFPQKKAAQPDEKSSISGQVKDVLGGVVADAEVVITDQNGKQQTVKTNQDGVYRFTNLAPGKYVIKVFAANFASFESREIEFPDKSTGTLDITLKVNIETQVVTVGVEAPLSSDLDNNANGLVMRGAELNSLPEDPQSLATALQGLSVAAGNQMGSQIIVDGFPGGRIPPKKAIREIRINKNPYSAEFNRPGNGRIEISTKPGADELSGGGFFGFNSDRLNTRDPFAANDLPYHSNDYGFYLGGPIKPKRVSFFFNFERGGTESNNLINATILDSNLNITPFNSSVSSSNRYLNFTPRVDVQLDARNTFTARYSYGRSKAENSGVGGFSLASRAIQTFQTEQSVQLTETAVLSPTTVNETRSQFVRRINGRQPNNFGLTIEVPGAFTDGASFRNSSNEYNRIEAGDIATFSLNKHTLRTGAGFRYVNIRDFSSQGFGGTYRFDGALAPQLNAGNNIVSDSNGKALLAPISGLERYRRTLSLAQAGFSAEEIRARGGGASQFTVAAGDEEAAASQYGIYGFIQDEWRLRPSFSIGLGLRFESQSNVNNKINFAPRLSFAWSKMHKMRSGKEAATFVLRGGIGFFYDNFGENYALRANRLNGLDQKQYIVTDPAILNLFPQLPAETLLKNSFAAPAIVKIDPDLRLPLSIQSNIGFEKQLPYNLVLSTNYLNVRTINALRTRFIRASSTGAAGRIFQYESTGESNQNQLSFTLSRRLGKSSFYAAYTLNKVKSNTEGADFISLFEDDYARAATDIRHSLYFGGWIRTPWNIDINPLVYYRTGVPYDIVVGRDLNGDSILNDRPAFATDLDRSSVVLTALGALDLDPLPGQSIIPRNYGTGPGFLSANLNVSRTFTIFNEKGSGSGNNRSGILGVQFPRHPLYVTLSVQVENLFNWTNPSLPEGNMSSPLFGKSYYSAGSFGSGAYMSGNRVIRPYIVFSF